MSASKLEQLVAGWQAAGDSPGVVALKALDYCVSDLMPPPAWILETITDCWQHYNDGHPVSAWESDISRQVRSGNVPMTMDAAFGVESKTRPAVKLNSQVKYYGPKIHWFIESGVLSRNENGYSKIAELIGDGITTAQVRRWYEEYQKQI